MLRSDIQKSLETEITRQNSIIAERGSTVPGEIDNGIKAYVAQEIRSALSHILYTEIQ